MTSLWYKIKSSSGISSMNLRASLFTSSNLAIRSSLVSSCMVEEGLGGDDKDLEVVVETNNEECAGEAVDVQGGAG